MKVSKNQNTIKTKEWGVVRFQEMKKHKYICTKCVFGREPISFCLENRMPCKPCNRYDGKDGVFIKQEIPKKIKQSK